MKNTVGVYQIVNTKTGRMYIGSAQRTSGRCAQHRYMLKNGKHFNAELQTDWIKYGDDVFKFNLLCECAINEMTNIESEVIKSFKPEEVYNRGPDGDIDRTKSDTHKLNCSIAHGGGKLIGYKLVDGEVNGEKIEFNHGGEAKIAGFSPAHIYSCIAGHRNSHKGYIWTREGGAKNLNNKLKNRPVIGINSTTGEQIELESLNGAPKHGFTSSSIALCLRGERVEHGGYIWKYKE